MRSAGTRFIIVGLLALCMFIPLFFAGQVIKERADYSRQTASSIGEEWGGAQILRGPELVIPVSETVLTSRREDIIDADTNEPRRDPTSGEALYRVVEEAKEVERQAIHLLPRLFDAQIETQTEIRRRGIFEVPVYRAVLTVEFDYDLDIAEAALTGDERLEFEEAALIFAISSNRALRGDAVLTEAGETLRLDPWRGERLRGLSSEVGDPRERGTYTLELGFQGADSLQIAPVGRTTEVAITSDWPHPSFNGAYLPDSSEVRDTGFDASWTIPHLARALPEVSRNTQLGTVGHESFGFRLFQPNDFYQKAYRAARYGILFIALTFLTVLLIENRTQKPTHPVQYVLIGLVQAMFVVLMVAYAEQIGFAAAYLLASCAVVALLTFYGWIGLRLSKRALVLGVMLAVLYGVLFLILRSADYALIAGATLVFAALAGTMWATRNEDWYGPETEKKRWSWARPAQPEVASKSD
ncbi:cell envelope integrity protein CreD [Shimia ponticola]|uniref:cell envelope integrity protein CreD n=1 Tax=Shimia ponticola TaxID=2582893 RepID=UPI0011BE8229|nr:cell envelope integrity protein CreD [Shimia ponticola]